MHEGSTALKWVEIINHNFLNCYNEYLDYLAATSTQKIIFCLYLWYILLIFQIENKGIKIGIKT